MTPLRTALLLVVPAMGLLGACRSNGSDDPPPPTLVGDALKDPNSCRQCHENAVAEWSGSMHAYASDDPVFLAMNKRMQRETGGTAGSLCVGCHAPVAVRDGLTTDGLNLATLPQTEKGVTCFFCHSVDSVQGTHNNPLHLATDGAMRGGITNPIAAPHATLYSALHDREQHDSASLCGTCHDVVTAAGAHVERTFDEWNGSLYGKPGQLTCGKCHMDGTDGPAATVPNAPTRRVHDHTMAGVDLALTPFTQEDAQKTAAQKLLDGTLITKLCVKEAPQGVIAEITLDDAFAGHNFPSGAAQDRRAWLELIAYRNGAVVYSSGAVADGQAATAVTDPDYWLLRDTIFDTAGKETHLFWQAATYQSANLPVAVTSDPQDPAFYHSVTKDFTLPLPAPDRVTMRVRMRPIDFELVNDLVSTGDLDPAVIAKIPTYDLGGATREWTSDGGYRCIE